MTSAIRNQNQNNKTIIWAVDPTQNPSDAKNLILEIEIWSKRLNCSIQPVSIFSNSFLNFPIQLPGNWREKYEELTRNTLSKYLKKTGITEYLPPKRIFTSASSKTKLATELANYAIKNKAVLIFANTTGNKLWNPFRLGSFSESLMAISRTPVVLLNPLSKPTANIESILFVTDFKRDSHVALQNLTPWAKAFNSQIIIFNQVERPSINMSELNIYWPSQTDNPESVLQNIEELRREKANRWSSQLKKAYVDSKILIHRERKSLALDIHEVAKKNAVGLIALASRTGLIGQTFLGSLAKEIALHSRYPVLIFYHPKEKRKSKLKYAVKTHTVSQENQPLL